MLNTATINKYIICEHSFYIIHYNKLTGWKVENIAMIEFHAEIVWRVFNVIAKNHIYKSNTIFRNKVKHRLMIIEEGGSINKAL